MEQLQFPGGRNRNGTGALCTFQAERYSQILCILCFGETFARFCFHSGGELQRQIKNARQDPNVGLRFTPVRRSSRYLAHSVAQFPGNIVALVTGQCTIP